MTASRNAQVGNSRIENVNFNKKYNCGRPITLEEQIRAFDGKPRIKGIVVNDKEWCKRYIRK